MNRRQRLGRKLSLDIEKQILSDYYSGKISIRNLANQHGISTARIYRIRDKHNPDNFDINNLNLNETPSYSIRVMPAGLRKYRENKMNKEISDSILNDELEIATAHIRRKRESQVPYGFKVAAGIAFAGLSMFSADRIGALIGTALADHKNYVREQRERVFLDKPLWENKYSRFIDIPDDVKHMQELGAKVSFDTRYLSQPTQDSLAVRAH